MMDSSKTTLSIDWEDFGQLFGKYHYGYESEPANGAIERQTEIILDLLSETNNKATFFILGILAKYRPELVKKIAARGHEIAIHGQNHESMFSMNPQAMRKDIEDCLKLVTDITGSEILGYRAPFFSVNQDNLYLLNILADLGFIYDSSIFPLKMPRYGIDGFSEKDTLYELPGGKQLVELPLTVATYFGRKFPVAGGGYIRLMPKALVNKIFNDQIKSNRNTMIYMHPYEFDTHKIDVSSNYPLDISRSSLRVLALNFRWNLFRNSVRFKIRDLLKQHHFITCLEKALNVKKNGTSTKLLGC